MNLTPTDKGAGFAGIMLASIAWFSAFKLDEVASLCHVNRWISKEPIFNWITRSYKNKATAILFTEIINFGVHGVTNPASVLFACGSTIVNSFMIFIGLPIRQKLRHEKGLL
jgi:hypothetical protein